MPAELSQLIFTGGFTGDKEALGSLKHVAFSFTTHRHSHLFTNTDLLLHPLKQTQRPNI